MTTKEYVKNLVETSRTISNDILTNESFDVEELEKVRTRMDDLIISLNYWIENGNTDRFCYELVSYIEWIMENYS